MSSSFLKWVVWILICFNTILYILYTSPLSEIGFANIFSQSFYSRNSVLNTPIIFIFDKVQLIFLSLLACVISKNCSPRQGHAHFFWCFMFSSRGHIILHFTFNTMAHSEWIFLTRREVYVRFPLLVKRCAGGAVGGGGTVINDGEEKPFKLLMFQGWYGILGP